MHMPSRLKAISRIEVVVLVAIAILVCALPFLWNNFKNGVDKAIQEMKTRHSKQDAEAFNGRVKLTGNPKKLTYKEFLAVKYAKVLPMPPQDKPVTPKP